MSAFEALEGHVLFPRQQKGENRGGGSNSLSGLVATLAPVFLLSSVIFIIFLILQKSLDRVYAPRTFLDSLNEDERTPKRGSGFLGFRKEIKNLADEFVVGRTSIDNYLWLRFFKTLITMCFVGCVLTWPILFPVNITGGGGLSGLDMLSFSNISPGPRYFAQCLTAWLFLAFVMYLISRETIYYVQLRQAYLLSPYMASRISSRTVLFMDVPESYRNGEYLRHIFPEMRAVWVPRDPGDLEDLVQERDDAATKLETGEVQLIKTYVNNKVKEGGDSNYGRGNQSMNRIQIDQKDRPTAKLKPLIGKKVDAIDWGRGELRRLIPEVLREQSEHRAGRTKSQSSCFIEFNSLRAAQAAYLLAAHQAPNNMIAKEIGMQPEDVIWKNLSKPWYVRKIIDGLCTSFAVFLCLFWTIPVAFIGALSNISKLTDTLPFLSFLNALPSQLIGLVTNLLPVILLAVLMALVPIIFTLLAKLFEPTLGAVQLKVQGWYFPFQVIQVFLITTFSSGAAAVAGKIADDPTQAPTLLAQNLPTASNFYIGYFILFGLLTAALQVLNLVPLLFFLILGKILDKTPRKMFNRYTQLGGLGWGALYPKITNLGVIALSYSSIAPLVLGFATVGFFLLYCAFRYNVFFTLGTKASTNGQSYIRALQQLTVGIYLSEGCLIGLFAIGTAKSAIATGPLILMIIFLVGTVIWQMQLRSAMHKLVVSLPHDMLAEEYSDLHGDRGGAGVSEAEKGRGDNLNGKSQYQIPQPQTSSQPPPASQKSFFGRFKAFLFPTKYDSAAYLSKHVLSPTLAEPVREYTEQERQEAYMHPAVVSQCPIIWIPRDGYGLSRQEVMDSQKEVGHEAFEMSDDAAWFDDKGKIQWNQDDITKVPIYDYPPRY